MIVVKVGGSLYDLPDLKVRLNRFLLPLAVDNTVIVVPGGGAVVDAVREWDLKYQIGEKACHQFALRSMALAGRMLHRIIDDSRWCCDDEVANEHGIYIVTRFRYQYQPETWDLTSDSMAAQIAIHHHAYRLILLKSVDLIPKISWYHAADLHIVDRHFPTIIRDYTGQIDIINFRDV